VPTARASRTISVPAEQLWQLVCDPHHLPRWWPRVARVEDVREGAFTQVMRTKKGKLVRADFDVRRDEQARTLTWVQRIAGTPFASVLRSAQTQVRVAPAAAPATAAGTSTGTGTGAGTGAPADGAFADERATGGREASATEVTIEVRQELGGVSAGDRPVRRTPFALGLMQRAGTPLVRRAARATIEQALDGLEQISG